MTIVEEKDIDFLVANSNTVFDDSGKLRLLADYFDYLDKKAAKETKNYRSNEVQIFLRELADRLEK